MQQQEQEFELDLDTEALVGDDDEEQVTTTDDETVNDEDADEGSVGEREAKSVLNKHEWAKDLDESLRKAPSLHKFKDIAALSKAYVELEKAQGKSPFPGPNSTEEERIAFFRKAGVPEPEKYSLDEKKYGINEEMSKDLKEIASKNGIAPNALGSVLDYINSKNEEFSNKNSETMKAIARDQLESIKKDYGTAFEKYLNLGATVAKEIYSQDELKVLKETGMSKNPLFVKVLMDRARSKYGEELIEDSHTKKNFVATPEAIEKRKSEIMSDEDYHNSNSSRHRSLVQEMEKLFKLSGQTA